MFRFRFIDVKMMRYYCAIIFAVCCLSIKYNIHGKTKEKQRTKVKKKNNNVCSAHLLPSVNSQMSILLALCYAKQNKKIQLKFVFIFFFFSLRWKRETKTKSNCQTENEVANSWAPQCSWNDDGKKTEEMKKQHTHSHIQRERVKEE